MSFKIPCGGFRLDEESFSLDENGVLSVSGGNGGDSSGSGSIMKVIISYADGTYTADKTYDEIKAAYDAGMVVYAVYPTNFVSTVLSLVMATTSYVIFNGIDVGYSEDELSSRMRVRTVSINPGNVVEVKQFFVSADT